jgi:serine/threonine protein kinase
MSTQINPAMKDQIGEGHWFSVSRAFNDRLQRSSLFLQLGFPCSLQRSNEPPSTDCPELTAVHAIVDGETPLAVLDDFEGRSLASILERGVSERVLSLSILRQIASALDRLHACGLVHGALKPTSILIGEGPSVRIVDWMVGWSGLPLRYLSDGAEYLAPERLALGQLGARADQFALGVISHQLLEGRRPFPGGLAEQLFRIRFGLPGEGVFGETSIASHVVYDRVFSTDPAERFDSCTSMVQELEKLQRRRAYSETRLVEEDEPASLPLEMEGGTNHDADTPQDPLKPLSRWWIVAAVLALFAFGLGVLNWRTQASIDQIAAQGERFADIDASGNLQDGAFRVCNVSPNPLEIRELAVAYWRANQKLSIFSSAADSQMRWSVAQDSSRLLTWPVGGKAVWDGSVLFYFARVQQGQKELIVSGHWSGSDVQDCLHFDLYMRTH